MTNQHGRTYRTLPALTLASALVLSSLSGLAEEAKSFSIQAQRTDQALLDLAAQSGTQIIFSPSIAKSFESVAVQNANSVQEALDTVLAGTDLAYEFTASNVVVVKKKPGENNVDVAKSIVLEEITVTATKRETSLQDTAMTISVLGNDDINKRGLLSMEDFLGAVPGVSMIDRGVGRNQVIIRGISADPTFGDPTAGIYFGDTPVTGLSFYGGSADIKLVDMSRVEVLRGPQGTLYGSSSLAGTVRNIPNPVNMEDFEGKVKFGHGFTAGDGGNNYKGVGTINIPIIADTLAIRASVYHYENSGYIKNIAGNDPVNTVKAANFGVPEIAINQDNIGATEYSGGRLAIRWQPTDKLAMTLTYLTQNLEQDGLPEVEVQLGKFEQSRLQMGRFAPNGHEGLVDNIDMINFVFDYDFGWAALSSSSSSYKEESARYSDISPFFDFPTLVPGERNAEVFTEELKLVSQLDGPLQFVAGFYYEDIENVLDIVTYYGGDPALNPFSDIVLSGFINDSPVQQTALFGELSYQLNDLLELTIGARFFNYDKTESNTSTGAFLGLPPGEFSVTRSDTSENGNTGKVNLSYTPNDSTLLYAQWSEGFRLGEPQLGLPPTVCDVDSNGIVDGTDLPIGLGSTEPDTLESFELGGKITLLDGRLSLNSAIYQYNWEGIPIIVIGDEPLCQLTANAGKAETQGVEVESSFQVTTDLSVDVGFSYTDAELIEDAPSLNGASGDRLPGSARFNANMGVEYDFSLAGHESYVRAGYTWIGGFYSDLKEQTDEAGDYGLVNLQAGLNAGPVLFELYVKNLTNEGEITFRNLSFGTYANRLRPRTVGFDISYQF